MPNELIEPKRFHNEPYWTPNNFDIQFPFEDIPVNIPVEKGHDLEKRLQKLMPLTKIIHVDYSPLSLTKVNSLVINSKVSVSFENNENKIVNKELKLL